MCFCMRSFVHVHVISLSSNCTNNTLKSLGKAEELGVCVRARVFACVRACDICRALGCNCTNNTFKSLGKAEELGVCVCVCAKN